MVVTITHRRAYAAKKGAVASVCASVVGPPDIKGITAKKAIELSTVGGGYKNVYCPVEKPGNCSSSPDKDDSKYFADRNDLGPWVLEDATSDKNSLQYTKVRYWEHGLKDGCGDYEETINKSTAYRLYKEGYCPVVIDSNGRLTYDRTAIYYESKGCDPNKETCVQNFKGDDVKFVPHNCEAPDPPP